MKRLGFAMAALVAAMPAAAQTPVTVGAFDEIELVGGGHVVLRQGAEQRVTMIRGSTEMSRFTVEDGRLRIEACVQTCRDYRLELEIVVPRIDGVAVTGGGAIRAAPDFGRAGALAASVTGGGAIDVAAIEAETVAASVRGGGSIRTRAQESLTAAVNGGGMIRYWGDPAVTQAVRGGGSIQRGEGS